MRFNDLNHADYEVVWGWPGERHRQSPRLVNCSIYQEAEWGYIEPPSIRRLVSGISDQVDLRTFALMNPVGANLDWLGERLDDEQYERHVEREGMLRHGGVRRAQRPSGGDGDLELAQTVTGDLVDPCGNPARLHAKDERPATAPSVHRGIGVRGNVWEYAVGGYHTTRDTFARKHPALMPEQLARDLIVSWSRPGDVVLDPFGGAGTTAKAALLSDRRYLSFEVHRPYHEIAARRLTEAHESNRRPLEAALARSPRSRPTTPA